MKEKSFSILRLLRFGAERAIDWRPEFAYRFVHRRFEPAQILVQLCQQSTINQSAPKFICGVVSLTRNRELRLRHIDSSSARVAIDCKDSAGKKHTKQRSRFRSKKIENNNNKITKSTCAMSDATSAALRAGTFGRACRIDVESNRTDVGKTKKKQANFATHCYR